MSVSATSISFQAQELSAKLCSVTHENLTGYWRFQWDIDEPLWYLACSQGEIIFSGSQMLSWQALLKIFQRYILRFRGAEAKTIISSLEDNSTWQEHERLSFLLEKMETSLGISQEETLKALQSQILSDFDQHLFDKVGQGQFITDSQLCDHWPIPGYNLNTLINQAQQRQQEWSALSKQIPSMASIPILDIDALKSSPLPEPQKQKLQKLTSTQQPLTKVAEVLAKDPLDLAKMFAKLNRNGLVKFQSQSESISPASNSVDDNSKNVFIVDDSPVFLQQFEALTTRWGYQVKSWSQTLTAVETMLKTNPSVAFLDINMPGLSGFDLIKEIRRHPSLASMALVLLTAENSLSNQWRAKWGNCQFLAKPQTRDDIPTFQAELRDLLNSVGATAQ